MTTTETPTTLPLHHPACAARGASGVPAGALPCSHACALRGRLAASAPASTALRARLAAGVAFVDAQAERAHRFHTDNITR